MPEVTFTFEFKNILFFLFAIIIIIAIILFIIKLKKFLSVKEEFADREMVKRKWREIESLMRQNSENSYKLAIMEADKLLDYALKSKMLPGSDLGGRLKSACARDYRLKGAWPAHIIRNKIVHDPHFVLSSGTAVSAIKSFYKALVLLGVL